jgi:hypothetical protein
LRRKERLDFTSTRLATGYRRHFRIHGSNLRRGAGSMAITASGWRSRWSPRDRVGVFQASCLDQTPVRPPVKAADRDPVGAASVLDHRGVDAVDAGAWIPRLCLPENYAKRVPDGRSPKARVYLRNRERSSRINPPGVLFLTSRLAQFYKQKPFTHEALGQALGRRGGFTLARGLQRKTRRR